VGPDAGKHLRNIVIIVAIAAAVWLLPGGGTGANALSRLISLIFLGGLAFFAYRMYMERRVTLLDLDDRARLVLYGSFTVVVFALVATARLWDGGGLGVLLWLALVGAGIYGIYGVYRTAREY
jgi:hypothetical protein